MDSVAILAIPAILAILAKDYPSGTSHRRPPCVRCFAFSGPKMAPKMSFLQTRFAHRLGLALGRVHDGFGAQHGPNLGRFWSHVGAILDHFWVLFWLLNLRPL